MTIEVVLLAFASIIRPTSLAAVYALVGSAAPRRFMIAYVVAGLAFTISFGLLVIWAFHGLLERTGTPDHAKAVAELVAGVVALVFAALVQMRVVGRAHPDDAPRTPGRWDRLRERRITLRTAALAGPATHIPGLFYLLALNAIVAGRAGVAVGFVEVVLYNLIWFTLPLAALVVCIVRPSLAGQAIGAIESWARAHARQIVVAGSIVAGIVLIIRGALSY